MTKYVQTRDELLGHLKDQIAFMKQSTDSYDKGFEGEAKRLAVAIRILVHDTQESKSLLTSLGKKNINFYDSASDYHPNGVVVSHSGLVLKKFMFPKGGGEYEAPLDDLPPSRNKNKKVNFDQWWDNRIVIRDSQKNTFTRKDLVRTVANTEGGAHVDLNLNQAYANLSRFHSLGWKFFRGEVAEDFKNNPALPSIRQIAHEVLKTLNDEFPELF